MDAWISDECWPILYVHSVGQNSQTINSFCNNAIKHLILVGFQIIFRKTIFKGTCISKSDLFQFCGKEWGFRFWWDFLFVCLFF